MNSLFSEVKSVLCNKMPMLKSILPPTVEMLCAATSVTLRNVSSKSFKKYTDFFEATEMWGELF